MRTVEPVKLDRGRGRVIKWVEWLDRTRQAHGPLSFILRDAAPSVQDPNDYELQQRRVEQICD